MHEECRCKKLHGKDDSWLSVQLIYSMLVVSFTPSSAGRMVQMSEVQWSFWDVDGWTHSGESQESRSQMNGKDAPSASMTKPSLSCVRVIEDHRGTCPRRENQASGVSGQCESGTHPQQPLHINTEVAKHLLEEHIEIVPAQGSETCSLLHTHQCST
jgi:hypothetical protein